MSAAAAIGVFDSGVGGLSILKALRAALPAEDFVYYADSEYAPYGERGDAFVTARTLAVARELVEVHQVKLLVVACNTATAAAVDALRQAWPQVPIVGVEPAIKPAALASRTGCVGVLATRGTLASERFRQLQAAQATRARFVLQPCDGLAAAIEVHDDRAIEALCARYVAALGPLGESEGQIDTVVLGCTHYAFAMPVLQRLTGGAVRILETGEAVARQALRLLSAAGLLREGQSAGRVTLLSSDVGADLGSDLGSNLASDTPSALHAAARRWLGE